MLIESAPSEHHSPVARSMSTSWKCSKKVSKSLTRYSRSRDPACSRIECIDTVFAVPQLQFQLWRQASARPHVGHNRCRRSSARSGRPTDRSSTLSVNFGQKRFARRRKSGRTAGEGVGNFVFLQRDAGEAGDSAEDERRRGGTVGHVQRGKSASTRDCGRKRQEDRPGVTLFGVGLDGRTAIHHRPMVLFMFLWKRGMDSVSTQKRTHVRWRLLEGSRCRVRTVETYPISQLMRKELLKVRSNKLRSSSASSPDWLPREPGPEDTVGREAGMR